MKLFKMMAMVAALSVLAACAPSYKVKLANVKTIAIGSVYINKDILKYDENGNYTQSIGGFIQNRANESTGETAKQLSDIDFQVVMQQAIQSLEGDVGKKMKVIPVSQTLNNANYKNFVQKAQSVFPKTVDVVPVKGMPVIWAAQSNPCLVGCEGEQKKLDDTYGPLANGPADAYMIVYLRPLYDPSMFSVMGMGQAHMVVLVEYIQIIDKNGKLLVHLRGHLSRTSEKRGLIAGMIPRDKETEALLAKAAGKATAGTVAEMLEEL